MTDPHLIAHIVRGEPAFDIAGKIECPECLDLAGTNYGCSQCDQLGFWWIIPTSGHRAYPYWSTELYNLGTDESWPGEPCFQGITSQVPPAPEGWPDHYPHSASPRAPKIDLVSALGLRKPVQIKRRF